MPLDSLCLTGVVSELQAAVTGGKIDKIYQPGRDEVVLVIRAPAGNVKLLLSANPSHPRAHITQISRENPEAPPMFCMLLRKHLTGARILELTQPHLERSIDIRLETLNELSDRTERRLVLELLNRRANLILLDSEGRITDCLRRVDNDVSSKRQVLPGMFYRLPPAQDKLDPTALNRAALEAILSSAPQEVQADRWLLDTFRGLSPLVCRELACRAGGSTDVRLNTLGPAGRTALLDALDALLHAVADNSFTPTLLIKDRKPFDFTFFPVRQYNGLMESKVFPSFSLLLDDFFGQREALERVRQKGQDLIRTVTNARNRTARKIGIQEQERSAAQKRDRLRQFGDIITSNFHRMSKGMSCLHAVDFFDLNGGEADIPLDPLLSPQQNAARYYRDYARAKSAEQMLTLQLERGRRELDYLNSVLETIELAEGERDLQEIRQELTETGYIRRPSKARAREKRAASRPMEFRSSTGFRISVGKNNTQNDLLTCKQAFKSDIWFHTQKIHGSHVILWTQGMPPDLQSLHEAACLAAWFSQGRENVKVAVDYTPVKYVKKPAGARPGMVVYTTYETVFVTPDEALVKTLRVK